VRAAVAGRRGLAFGVKQAAVPFTSVLGGLAVPALGLTIGWRWAFAGAAGLAAVAVCAIPSPRTTLAERRRARGQQADVVLAPLLVLALGFGLSMLSIAALTTFLVTSAVAAGLGKGVAGLLVGLAGGVAVLVRIGVGAGWGWNGVFNMAVSSSHPAAPAKASGITLTGNRIAGIAGPFLFALVVTHTSYLVAWLAAAVATLAAATVMFAGDRMLSADPTKPVA
jgi:MFS family permease